MKIHYFHVFLLQNRVCPMHMNRQYLSLSDLVREICHVMQLAGKHAENALKILKKETMHEKSKTAGRVVN